MLGKKTTTALKCRRGHTDASVNSGVFHFHVGFVSAVTARILLPSVADPVTVVADTSAAFNRDGRPLMPACNLSWLNFCRSICVLVGLTNNDVCLCHRSSSSAAASVSSSAAASVSFARLKPGTLYVDDTERLRCEFFASSPPADDACRNRIDSSRQCRP